MELTESIRTKRTRVEVFDAWARIDRAAGYDPAALERRKLSEGAIGKGSRFAAVDRWPGRDVAYVVEITAFERPERIAATWSDPLSGGWDAIFETVGEDTEMRFHATLDPSGATGLLLRLLAPWYRHHVRASLESFCESLVTDSVLDD